MILFPSSSGLHPQTSVGVSTNDTLQSNANTNNASAGSVFSNFNHEVVGSGVSVSVSTVSEPQSQPQIAEDVVATNSVCTPTVSGSHSPTVMQRLHSPHPAESAMMNEVVDLQPGSPTLEEKASSQLEPTNVCKVFN